MRMVPFKPEYDVCIGGSDLDEMIQAALDARSVAEALEGLEFSAPAVAPPPGIDVSRIVTFVVDQSGSQRGRPLQDTLTFLDEAARLLEEQGVAFEVIGHTTPDWKGGRTFKAYKEEGQPYPAKGTFWRLNESLVMVHKSVGESWFEDGRPRFKATAVDFFRFHHENFDQVALEEAASRLKKLGAAEGSIVLVGDMCPSDEATMRHADGGSMVTDLRLAIWDVQKMGVDVIGIESSIHATADSHEAAGKALRIDVARMPDFKPWKGQAEGDFAAEMRGFAEGALPKAAPAPVP